MVSNEVMESQARAARVVSFDNYVALRGMINDMAALSDDGGIKSDEYDRIATKFSEGYAEMSEYAALSGRLDAVSPESVKERVMLGLTDIDAYNLDGMLRRGILEGMPFKQRIAFVEADIASGVDSRPQELQRWLARELNARVNERGVDLIWSRDWTERAANLRELRRKHGLHGNEAGIDPALARQLEYGKPLSMLEVEAFANIKAARVRFDDAWRDIKGIMARNPDEFDEGFVAGCEKYVEESCAEQDSDDIMITGEEKDRVFSLMDLDLSAHPEKYGIMNGHNIELQMSFDFDAIDAENAPANEGWDGDFDV